MDNSASIGSGSSQGDASIWEAIQTFETILEVFPEDVNALESLVDSYEQMGEHAKARDKALKLIRLMTKEGDLRHVAKLAERLLKFDPNDADAKEILDSARVKLGDTGPAGKSTVTQAAPALTVDLTSEVNLAWHLLQNEVIDQVQYERSIETLTQSSMQPHADIPVSLLMELREVEHVDMEKVVAFLAAESGIPYVDLSICDCDEEAVARLTLPQVRKLGILPFSRIGSDITVALLNPIDKDLRTRVTAFFGCPVHFFFTAPEDFLAACSKLVEKQKRQKK